MAAEHQSHQQVWENRVSDNPFLFHHKFSNILIGFFFLCNSVIWCSRNSVTFTLCQSPNIAMTLICFISECALSLAITSFVIYELLFYMTSRIFYKHVDVTEIEQKLFAVKDGERGFRRLAAKTYSPNDPKSVNSLTFSSSDYQSRSLLPELSSLRQTVFPFACTDVFFMVV